VETGTVDEIFYQPEMPYSWGLLASMPRMDRQRQDRLQPIAGQPPSLIRVPKGCVFNPRCRYQDKVADNLCVTQRPELLPTGNSETHSARCHIHPDERRRTWAEEIAPTL
jgi:peptide/nickel transport system ATP-binding protein